VADVLFVFGRFQKRLQSDKTTLIDMHVAVTHVQSALVALKQKPLLGGWQETFQESATETDGDLFLKGIQLSAATKRREQYHLFVTDKRSSAAVCNEIIE